MSRHHPLRSSIYTLQSFFSNKIHTFVSTTLHKFLKSRLSQQNDHIFMYSYFAIKCWHAIISYGTYKTFLITSRRWIGFLRSLRPTSYMPGLISWKILRSDSIEFHEEFYIKYHQFCWRSDEKLCTTSLKMKLCTTSLKIMVRIL
jgi:hypothetical protein